MRFTTDLLTPLTAFCLFGSGSHLAAQENQFNPLIVEQSTAGEAAANAVFGGMQFNEQAGDREVNRVSPPGRGARSTAAAWLGQHPGDRVLIVGYRDDSGSEACTAALAERRAEVVRQFLLSLGTRTDQVAGVKGWENLNGACRAGVTECRRQNRSARLFLAEPAGSLK